MDPEERKLLEETHALTQENNKILHSMRRSLRWQRIMSTLYWVIVIGSAIGAFYLLQPYLLSLMDAYDAASGILRGTQTPR